MIIISNTNCLVTGLARYIIILAPAVLLTSIHAILCIDMVKLLFVAMPLLFALIIMITPAVLGLKVPVALE
ncbi:MAG: hypothetical protein ACD_7C00089G0001 [uncultured bacterium]|nr:MAG: hypothetical protein ACD_7C00089G0001 [uncultured bacterium]